MESDKKRLNYLDSIRGIAALFVLFSHLVGAFVWPERIVGILTWPFFVTLIEGKSAVAMFFVLSGFVLSRPFVVSGGDERQRVAPRNIPLAAFYVKRLLRIWPPWFAVFCLSIMAKHFFLWRPATIPPATGWLDHLWSLPLTAKSFFLQCVFGEHDAAAQLLNQDWSLSVELKGSLLIPLFVVVCRPGRLWLIALTAAVLFISFLNGQYYVSFIMGVGIARFGGELTMIWQKMKGPGHLALLVTGLFLYQGLYFMLKYAHLGYYSYKIGWLICSLGCCCILVASLNSRLLQRTLNLRPLVFLGRISYSLYLVQFIIILCAVPPVIVWFNRMGITSSAVLMPVIFLIATALSVGLAEVIYRLVEIPTIAIGRNLSARLENKSSKGGQALG